MCGIFGWVKNGAPHTEEDLAHARKAVGDMAHRGPDNHGEWLEGSVYMAHRRLSILDLSNAANQPFIHPAGDVLVFNGEIYNYIELREELRELGHSFTTDSDTEVLLAALIEWGIDGLNRLDGMFAGAWHQKASGKHILFRDPLGQKPIYLATDKCGWIYSSELRAILALPQRDWILDKDCFARFLFNSYYGGADTPVKDVQKLLPGCVFEITATGAEIKRYWKNRPGMGAQLNLSDEDAVNQCEKILRDSCVRTMRSDVPYGVFLSGGLDSALVFDFCREQNANVQSFNISMSEKDFDESEKAQTVCDHLGAHDHHVFTLDQAQIQSAMSYLMEMSDEPHGDPGYVNSYFLAKAVRPFITVGIAGDGGDELFAGYEPFSAARPAQWLKHFSFLAYLGRIMLPLLPETDTYVGLKFKVKAFLQGFPAIPALRLPLWLGTQEPSELAKLCGRGNDKFFSRDGAPGSLLAPYRELGQEVEGQDEISHYLNFYQQVFLPEFVCMHTDRAAMLNSLEVRAPFLSPELIKFANAMPNRQKIRGGTKKWILRELAKKRGFPGSITKQRKKGFTFPIARWLKGPLKTHLDTMLWHEGWALDGLVDSREVKRLYDDHMAGRANNYRILFNLLVFRAWRNKFPQVKVTS